MKRTFVVYEKKYIAKSDMYNKAWGKTGGTEEHNFEWYLNLLLQTLQNELEREILSNQQRHFFFT